MLDLLPAPTLAITGAGVQIALTIASLASAGYSAYRLLNQKEPANKDPQGENKANERGVYIPLLVGKFRVKAIHMADLRSTRFGQKNDNKFYRYEQARFLLGIGFVKAYTSIYNQDGKQLWDGYVTADTHGPNNPFQFEQDHFDPRLFPQFGDRNQIVDGQEPDLRSGSTVFNSQQKGKDRQQDLPSAYNHFAFVGANPWNLGVEGQVFGGVYFEGIAGLAPQLMDFEDGQLKYMTNAEGETGMNAAHVAGLLTVAPFPQGQAASPDLVSPDGLLRWASAMRTDGIVTSMEIEGGPGYGDTMDTLLVESNVAAPLNEGILDFIPVRGDSPIYQIPLSAVALPESRRTIYQGDRPISFSNYSFDDEGKQHNKSDVALRDNSQFNRTQRYSIETGTIATTCWPASAQRIAARLAMSAFGAGDETSMEVSRGARRLLPGNKIQIEGDPRVLLVTQTRPIIGTGRTEITAVVDAFSFGDFLLYVEPDDGVDTSLREPASDIRVTFIPKGGGMGVLRVRGNEFVESAAVYLITGGDPINLGDQVHVAGGTTAEAFSGPLGNDGTGGQNPDTTEIWRSDDPDFGVAGEGEQVIKFGPELNSDSDSLDGSIDLTGDNDGLIDGRQVMVIESGSGTTLVREIFFIRRVGPITTDPSWQPTTEYAVGDFVVPNTTPTGFRYECVQSAGVGPGGGGNAQSLPDEPEWTTTANAEFDEREGVAGSLRWKARRFRYEPRDLIRARQSTAEVAHPAGSSWWIFQASQIEALLDPAIPQGGSYTIKTQPYTEGGAVDLATQPAVTRVLSPTGV